MRGPFRWDPRTARYHEPATGRIVGRSEVRRAIDDALDSAQREMLDAAEALRSGKRSLVWFRNQMQKALKDTHLYSAAAARGGWAQMTRSDTGRVGRELRDQYEYLDGMVRAIKAGRQKLDGSFTNRVRLYAQSGRKTYHKLEGVEMRRLGMNEERNVENPQAEHCDGCTRETERRWVPIGKLVPIGDRDCLNNDRCEIEYRRGTGRRLGNPLTWAPEDFPPANPDGADSLARFQRADGTFTPERQALHDALVNQALRGQRPASGQPIVNVLGGGPASGKSVTLKAMGDAAKGVTIDVDEIRQKLPEYKAMSAAGQVVEAAPYVHEESSLIGKRIQGEAVARGFSFVADGTGDSGIEKLAGKVAQYRSGGARIIARYVTVDTDEAIRRADARGVKTGRYVPHTVIRDTHADVSRTFEAAIERGIFDEFELWDTNFQPSRKIVEGRGRELIIHDREAWERFLAKGR